MYIFFLHQNNMPPCKALYFGAGSVVCSRKNPSTPWRGDSSQFSKPLLRELAALRLIGTPGVTGFWREHTALSAHSLSSGRLHNLSQGGKVSRSPWTDSLPCREKLKSWMTNPDLNLRYIPDLRLKCDLMSRYFTFSANISRKLIVRIPPEIQMARNPRCMERFPPIPAPIAKKKIIPK